MKDTMNRRDFIRNSVVTGGVLLAHAALPANARNLTYDMYVPTRVMFGAGMLDKLSEQPMPGKRALIVISNGKSTRANGYLSRTEEQLHKAGVETFLFDGVMPNPTVGNVDAGAKVARENGCDFLVALGGGSSGISTSERDAASLVSDATFEESMLLTSSTLGDMDSRIPAWLEGLGASREESGNGDTPVTGNSIRLTLDNGTVFTATLAENSSAEALKALLAEGDLTIEMSDYGNMEKVGPIGQSLPRNDEHITTSPGDLILYQGSNLVIYYAPNTYTFTRLGRIDNVEEDELRTALGEGSVTVTLSLDNNG